MRRNSRIKVRVGHSPDADDAFMFYALAKGKIPTDGLGIEHVVEDIENLNERAFRAELEVTALSCHAFGYLTDHYQLLPYGASVGEGYGPIVIASATPGMLPRNDVRNGIRGARIAVPGRYTTAFLILQLYEPDFQPVFTPFDKIQEVVEKGEVDFGLFIHEGQLTYQGLGLQKVVDLGEWWKEEYGLPLPLGVNAIRRDLDEEVKARFAQIFKDSIVYAMSHREEAMRYALEFGRGIDTAKGDRFVGMYVNPYSLDLGEKGRQALKLLYELGWKKNLLSAHVKLASLTTGSCFESRKS